MLTCLLCIMFDFFSKRSKLQKIRSIWIIDTIIANKKHSQPSHNLPCYFQFFHSISLFLLYLPFLPSFYLVPPFIGFCDATGTVSDWWVYSILQYARRLTTFYILARWYTLSIRYTRSPPDVQLTSTFMLFVPIHHLAITLPCWDVELICSRGIGFYFIPIVFLILLTFSTEIIAYFTQFSPSLSELNPSAEHIVHFENYTASLLWDYSAILYTPLRRSFTFQTSPSSCIHPIRSAYSAVWNFPDTIEETSHHKVFLIRYRPQYTYSWPTHSSVFIIIASTILPPLYQTSLAESLYI